MKPITAPVVALLLQGILFATAQAAPVQEAAGNGGGGLFAVDPGVFLWTLVIFLGVLFVLGKFAWGPILGALDVRESKIRESIDEARDMREEAQRLLAEHKQQLADARRQSQEIVAEGREAGERIRREIEAKARESGEELLERARREIERERDQAVQLLRREAVDLALAAASKLLRERLDDAQDRDLVRGFLEELENEEHERRPAGV
jgi:F-type H+-transporting ATPase subunit b